MYTLLACYHYYIEKKKNTFHRFPKKEIQSKYISAVSRAIHVLDNDTFEI